MSRSILKHMLYECNDNLGHNDTTRLYQFLKRQYYWKGLKESVQKSVIHCLQCQTTNLQTPNYVQLHLERSQTQWVLFKQTKLTHLKLPCKENNMINCNMHVNKLIKSIPMPDKSADIVANTYVKRLYCRFRGSWKILSDNGSEFKNSLFSEVELRNQTLISIPLQTQSQQMHRNFTQIP